MPPISAEKLVAWNDATAQRWRDLLLANPLILVALRHPQRQDVADTLSTSSPSSSATHSD